MSSHTPEPWAIDIGTDWQGRMHLAVTNIAPAPEKLSVCSVTFIHSRTATDDANAARIVACVNACAGMDDPSKDIPELQGALSALLALYDEETGTIDVQPSPTCSVCTSGTVPNSLNKGLCALHRARKIAAKEGRAL